jgi:hypothetical protein
MGAIDVRLGQIEFSSIAEIFGEAPKHSLQDAVLHPILKSAMTRRWRRIPSRKIRPGCASPQDPQDTVEDVPRIPPRPATLVSAALPLAARESHLDRFPLLVGEVHPHL